ncbi:hypothetical protein B9Q03_14775 [Candidatus Marsarchaeota G2 archaeon OSP_D]|nr:MAG: hypothetical protein B9Q03_14775 [Candidatus Marsarchaeota G2 archaeon OSP_D]
MITHNGAKIMKLKDYGLENGCQANLLVFEEKSVHEIFRNMARPKHVLRLGVPLLTSTTKTRFHQPHNLAS